MGGSTSGKHVGNLRQGASVRQCVSTGAALETLAARVSGLVLCFSDPERFHLEKHAIASELRRLARQGGRNA